MNVKATGGRRRRSWRASAREKYRRVELGNIHFEEESRGSLLICLNSIDQQASQRGNESLPDS
jgi:hypothetical protein